MTAQSSIIKLLDLGQSVWQDNLSRDMLQSGALKKQIEERGIRGITSNPSIFHKAIANSNVYDRDIGNLAKKGKDAEEVYEALVIDDIQSACDLLRPVYDESEGKDGFVSLEVSPHLAHHTQATMEACRHLHTQVNRPNLFIKIPGTEAGLTAIENMLYEGISVNITLLFGIDRYEAVAWAYIQALERRLKEGKEIDKINSVASFFISRIDVLVDPLLAHRVSDSKSSDMSNASDLWGKSGVANAKLAYQRFKKIQQTDRWQKLEDEGARVQRMLWASTSTKNPDYSDVMYVEPLIGPDTVNTMPEKTIDAFEDHGKIRPNTVEQDIAEQEEVMDQLQGLGIRFDCVTFQLENEGIQKFIDPYDATLQAIEEKIK